jgi:hypothetical protein
VKWWAIVTEDAWSGRLATLGGIEVIDGRALRWEGGETLDSALRELHRLTTDPENLYQSGLGPQDLERQPQPEA